MVAMEVVAATADTVKAAAPRPMTLIALRRFVSS